MVQLARGSVLRWNRARAAPQRQTPKSLSLFFPKSKGIPQRKRGAFFIAAFRVRGDYFAG
jgi:hypothetical protein